MAYNRYINVIPVPMHAYNIIWKENRVAYTLDTKLGDILQDPHAVEILERYAPGATKNPMIMFAKGMSLRSLLDLPQAKQAGITEDMVNKVLGEINAGK